MDTIEHKVYTIKSRIKDMYLRLGYNASGTKRLNSTPVEEKSRAVEVDRTAENSSKDLELDALRRALQSKKG